MTHNEYVDLANKFLELMPGWQAIAVDQDNRMNWFSSSPAIQDDYWVRKDNIGEFGYMGKIPYEGNWRDSLVVRKWIPKMKEVYFIPSICYSDLFQGTIWGGFLDDFHRLDHNLVFKTKEEAVLRAKELLGIKEDI